MKEIAVRDDFEASLDDARAQVDHAIARVATIGDGTELAQARIALGAAAEMARLHGMASGLRRRLTRLELHIARRAGQLGVTVKGVNGATAKWYADKTDVEIEALIERHAGKSAASSIMKAETAHREYVRSIAEATQATATQSLKVADAGETLTALVEAAQEEFYDRDVIHVHDLTDYVAELVGIPTFDESVSQASAQGLRLGLWDACRKALASGELDDPRLAGLPRWITCLSMDRGDRVLYGDAAYVRVPTAKATLGQLNEYIELIERKARESLARAADLREIHDSLAEAIEGADAAEGHGHTFPAMYTVGEAATLTFRPSARRAS